MFYATVHMEIPLCCRRCVCIFITPKARITFNILHNLSIQQQQQTWSKLLPLPLLFFSFFHCTVLDDIRMFTWSDMSTSRCVKKKKKCLKTTAQQLLYRLQRLNENTFSLCCFAQESPLHHVVMTSTTTNPPLVSQELSSFH